MSDLPELEILMDAFPNYPRSELATRLLCASSAEVLFNELAEEVSNKQESTKKASSKKVFDDDVESLKELFPVLNKDVLAAALHRNNGSTSKTIEELLQGDSLQRLAQTCGLEESLVEPYLARNKNDVLRALADLLAHYRKRKKVRTSRVQTAGASSVAYKDAYTINEHSTELNSLKECIWAEPALQRLNYDFYLKSFEFFQGDVSRVLDVSRLFIESGCENVTFDNRLGFQRRDIPPFAESVSSVLRLNHSPPFSAVSAPRLGDNVGSYSTESVSYKSAALGSSPTFLGPDAKSLINGSRSKTTVQLHKPTQVRHIASKPTTLTATSRLDLHGYTVAEAVSAVREVANSWWAEEREGRTNEGHVERYGTKAEMVEPLNIITGRGIHSAGGEPKIRSAVIRFLSKEGYVLDENIGSVSLIGKKPKRA